LVRISAWLSHGGLTPRIQEFNRVTEVNSLAMSYLIDGNNVMCQRVGWHKDKSRARRTLLDDVALLAGRKRITIKIVFDGAPDPAFPDGARFKGITVCYAEKGSNADERIKKLVECSSERRTLRVVTSDRDLANYVRRCGAQVIRSGEFRKLLDETIANPDATEVKVNEPEEGWMRYFGSSADDDEE